MEIQQTDEYAAFIRRLGWTVAKVDGSAIFMKRFWIFGGLAKLQRCTRLPDPATLLSALSRERIRTLAVEPDAGVPQTEFTRWLKKIPGIRINRDPFLPTKTIRVDLRGNEKDIFASFTEAKRRAVRKAEKNGVSTAVSRDIRSMLSVKNRSAGILGFITTSGMETLWNSLSADKTFVVLAYERSASRGKPIGGVFVIVQDAIAYYWIAGATRTGKKLFAPTLLVWEALRESRRRGCSAFDFVGVFDERMPKNNTEWKGFTKFKEGFGGSPLYYPTSAY